MLSAESRQLTFAFADSPQGSEGERPSDESVGKSYLLLKAEVKEAHDLATRAAGPDRLLTAGLDQTAMPV